MLIHMWDVGQPISEANILKNKHLNGNSLFKKDNDFNILRTVSGLRNFGLEHVLCGNVDMLNKKQCFSFLYGLGWIHVFFRWLKCWMSQFMF